MSENFYDVLGVSSDASTEDIKQAYRSKATEYHPDVSDDPDAEEKFKKIQKAKQVLTDEEKREAYDQMGGTTATNRPRTLRRRRRGRCRGMGGGPFGGMVAAVAWWWRSR